MSPAIREEIKPVKEAISSTFVKSDHALNLGSLAVMISQHGISSNRAIDWGGGVQTPNI